MIPILATASNTLIIIRENIVILIMSSKRVNQCWFLGWEQYIEIIFSEKEKEMERKVNGRFLFQKENLGSFLVQRREWGETVEILYSFQKKIFYSFFPEKAGKSFLYIREKYLVSIQWEGRRYCSESCAYIHLKKYGLWVQVLADFSPYSKTLWIIYGIPKIEN